MTHEEASKLNHGLYVLFWKTGGYSLVAVGSLHDGTRWFAATNWTGQTTAGILSTRWTDVERVSLVVERGDSGPVFSSSLTIPNGNTK